MTVRNKLEQNPCKIQKPLGKKIANCRQAKHYTQQELADFLNLSPQQIQKYEHGKTTLSVCRLIEIGNVLNVSSLKLLSSVLNQEQHNSLSDPLSIQITQKIEKLTKQQKIALLSFLNNF